MRLFVAVAPPAEVVEDLDTFLDPRRDAAGHIRWSPPAHWHLTLAFMPEVDPDRLDRLVDALTDAAARVAPPGYALHGALAFPTPYAARILALGVDDPRGLTSVAGAVRNACSAAGAGPHGGPLTRT